MTQYYLYQLDIGSLVSLTAVEETGCKIICGAPTTLAVKGLMMMMMMMMMMWLKLV